MKKLLMGLAAMLFIPAAGASYKCVDEKGVTRFGDTPPPECEHVPMYELSPSGAIKRKIDPTPTAGELKSRLEDQEKAKEAEHAAAEQKRKDNALLASYANEKEFDMARDRNIEPIASRIKMAEDRKAELDKRIKDLQDEMEFYKAGKKAAKNADKPKTEAPAILQANIDRANNEKASLDKSIEGYRKQIEDMKAKYEADKKRWIALKTGSVAR